MRRFLAALATASTCCFPLPVRTQEVAATTQNPSPAEARSADLDLPSAELQQLRSAMGNKDYRSAQAILLRALNNTTDLAKRARLLSFLGSVYFAAGDFPQAAIAWKKADALRPLEPNLRFSLAMAYVRLGHGDWARAELQKLAVSQPQNALYPYWIGRLAYDAQDYDGAIHSFETALRLDPSMARAHDNLGLCYFYQNRNALAEQEYRKAISLETTQSSAAAWPHLNLGILLEFLGKLNEAAAETQRAIALDPKLAQAYFEAGKISEKQDNLESAAASFREASRLDPAYAEPHVALARILRRQGDSAGAEREVSIYKHLHFKKDQGEPAQASPP